MAWDGKALLFGLHALAQRDGRDHDLTGRVDAKHGFPILSDKVTLVTSGTTGVDNFWLNPTGREILILDAFLHMTTEATGAATADVGIGATATTSDDTLMDGVDIGAAAILATASNNPGTDGGTGRIVASGEYVTVDWKADPAGGVGILYVLYVPTG